jgi:protein O-GlcNAc transferase
MNSELYQQFMDQYMEASGMKPERANDLFLNCIMQSNTLIEQCEKLNYLEIFRFSTEIYNIYYKNAELLIRTIGLNTSKTTLNDQEKQILSTAITRLRKCYIVDPLNIQSNELFRLVFVYLSQYTGDIDEKIVYLKQVLSINPIDYELHMNIGLYYNLLNKLDDAILHFKTAYGILNLQIKNDPDNQYLTNTKIKCLNQIGSIYSSIQDRNLAEYYFKKALELNPDDPDINNQLGALNTELRNTERAIGYYLHGIKHYTKAQMSTDKDLLLASMNMNMGMAYCYECNFTKAIECYNTALKLKPNLSLAYQNKLLDLNYISHLIEDPMYVSKCHRAINKIYPKVITDYKQSCPNYKVKNDTVKLNIGFVSGDFTFHPVSYFIKCILKLLNRDKFTITCFSSKIIQTDTMENITWVITKNKSNIELFNIIQENKIDILFDLSAHTGDNRLDTFVLKPAPIQISYCGYPGSSGIKSIDYHLTDCYCDSPDTQKYYQEKLVFMKNCFLAYTPALGIENLPALTLDQPCVNNKYITFGSFNRLNKINDTVISVWEKILLAIPNSRLNIKTKEFSTEKLKNNFMEKMKRVANQIVIMDYTDTMEQHLNDYNSIDIALDTFPYSGTTTSCEALLMGVPLITLYDNVRHYHSQNVTSSLLKNSDLEEFVCYSQQEYINRAIKYSEELNNNNRLKGDIRDKFINGHVCNYQEFVNDFEETIRDLYANHAW